MRREGLTMAVNDRFERLPLLQIRFAKAANEQRVKRITFVFSAAS